MNEKECCIFCSTDYKKNYPIKLFKNKLTGDILETRHYLYCPSCNNLYIQNEVVELKNNMYTGGYTKYEWIGDSSRIQALIQAHKEDKALQIETYSIKFKNNKTTIEKPTGNKEIEEEYTSKSSDEADDFPF